MSQVEDGVAEHYHHLLVLSEKSTRKRLVLGFENSSLPDPLPELCLRGPELFLVPADHKCGLLFLFFLICAQFDPHSLGNTSTLELINLSLQRRRDKQSYTTPEGEASRARRRLNDSEPTLS